MLVFLKEKKMKKYIIITFILFLSHSLYSSVPTYIFTSANDSLTCSEAIKVSFVQTSKKTYEPNDADIEIVFDGVFVDYPFEQLGYIEISGNDTTDISEIMGCLRSTAAIKGADAVINIKRQNTKGRTTFSGILVRRVDESDEQSSAGQPDTLVNDGEIELVFDGIHVDYPFEQLGYIEVYGSDSTEINDLIESLRSTALHKSADAVINIKRQDTDDKTTFSGILIRSVGDEPANEQPYVPEPYPKAILGIFSAAIITTIYIVSRY